jgi:tRNA(Ile)-lysidine synthase
MDIDVRSGRYVVAVSGGVDSVVLLHILRQIPNVHLTVAHFDHGIREDSAEDRKLVQALAKQHGLPFVYHRAELGAGVSEAVAREARYKFLHDVRRSSGAGAIITAHHQDDLLETIILNLLRGTGRRGLSSLKSTDIVKRPLLHVPKSELLRYAEREGLHWHEDSTNADERYLRNYVRKNILPRFAVDDREALLQVTSKAARLNSEVEVETLNYLHLQPATHELDRHQFILLPHAVAREIMAEWLLQRTQAELSRQLLERLVVAAKTGKAGSKFDVDLGHWLGISRSTLALIPRER